MIKKITKITSIVIPVILLSVYITWSVNTIMHDMTESTYCGTILAKDRSYRSSYYRSSYFEFGVKWDVGHVNTYPVNSILYNTKSIGDRICITDEWGRIYPEGSNGFRVLSSVLGASILVTGIIFFIIILIIAMYKKIWEK